jgi:hypothetical protein
MIQNPTSLLCLVLGDDEADGHCQRCAAIEIRVLIRHAANDPVIIEERLRQRRFRRRRKGPQGYHPSTIAAQTESIIDAPPTFGATQTCVSAMPRRGMTALSGQVTKALFEALRRHKHVPHNLAADSQQRGQNGAGSKIAAIPSQFFLSGATEMSGVYSSGIFSPSPIPPERIIVSVVIALPKIQ